MNTLIELVLRLAGLVEAEGRVAKQNAIRVAINQEHVGHRETLAGAREVALFPPMTGG